MLRERLADLGYKAGLHDLIDGRARFAIYETPGAFHDGRAFGHVPPIGMWRKVVRARGVTLEWRTLAQQLETVEMIRPPVKVGA